jgi:signal transduction histidine kinase
VTLPHSTASAHDTARERTILRDLAHTLVRAPRADAVYAVALERVTPWIGASFASVFVRGDDPETLTLAAAHRWPARFQGWIGALRVRVGRGPSGLAVGEGRLVEVSDLFDDPDLAEWQEVARELEMRSMLAAPLRASTGVLGALTFYFANETTISDRERELIESVADHVALAAERAMLEQELRRTNAALVDANAELERQYVEVVEARKARDRFLGEFASDLLEPLATADLLIARVLSAPEPTLSPIQRADLVRVQGDSARLTRAARDLVQLAALKRGDVAITRTDVDPRLPLRAALDAVRLQGTTAALRLVEPTVQLPPVHTDGTVVTEVLTWLVDHAAAQAGTGRVDASFEVGRGWVAWRVAHDGLPLPPDAMARAFDEFRQFDGSPDARRIGAGGRLALARRWVQRLGGELRLDEGAEHAAAFTFILPLDADVSAQAAPIDA